MKLRLFGFEYEAQYHLWVKRNVVDSMSQFNTDGLENASVGDEIICVRLQFGKNEQGDGTDSDTILNEKEEFREAIVIDDIPSGVVDVEKDGCFPNTKEECSQEQTTHRYCNSLQISLAKENHSLKCIMMLNWLDNTPWMDYSKCSY